MSDRIEPPSDSLADRIRSEADIAARPGQHDRLYAIADEVEDVYGYRFGGTTDEGAFVDHDCGWQHTWPTWCDVPVADLLTVIREHKESGCD